jgi:hypothetical protein
MTPSLDEARPTSAKAHRYESGLTIATGRRLVVALALSACIGAGDMFAPEKPLVGQYTLFQRESGAFDIGGPGKPAGDAGGYVDGLVDSVGWSATQLLVWRSKATFDGDGRGWMIVDVVSGRVSGPISSAARQRDAALASIPVRTATDVWNGR